jgi:hypothetical protein
MRDAEGREVGGRRAHHAPDGSPHARAVLGDRMLQAARVSTAHVTCIITVQGGMRLEGSHLLLHVIPCRLKLQCRARAASDEPLKPLHSSEQTHPSGTEHVLELSKEFRVHTASHCAVEELLSRLCKA